MKCFVLILKSLFSMESKACDSFSNDGSIFVGVITEIVTIKILERCSVQCMCIFFRNVDVDATNTNNPLLHPRSTN